MKEKFNKEIEINEEKNDENKEYIIINIVKELYSFFIINKKKLIKKNFFFNY